MPKQSFGSEDDFLPKTKTKEPQSLRASQQDRKASDIQNPAKRLQEGVGQIGHLIAVSFFIPWSESCKWDARHPHQARLDSELYQNKLEDRKTLN